MFPLLTPNVADPNSEETILFIDQPDQYHNVSQLQFGLDGYLYIGSGDGGFVGDPDNRAQNLSELLGKILRIDVDGAFPYAIPPSNPFAGVANARPEIWAYGVRNPWRFSFDSVTGDMYMGDVGQWTWEEINFQPGASAGGENYGWRLMEGFHCYDPPSNCFDPSLTLPIFEHEHSFPNGECAVTGGYVYRGARFPRFEGKYFYGDYCSGRVWIGFQAKEWVNVEVLNTTMAITTFGEDEDGELYLADFDDGMIYKLIDPQPFCDLELNQETYQNGDTVTASPRLVNLGGQAANVRLQATVSTPNGNTAQLADRTLTLAAGSEQTPAPVELITVAAPMPRGTYVLTCSLNDSGTGALIHAQSTEFVVE